MLKKHLVDTNIFLRYFLGTPKNQYLECELLFKGAKQNKFDLVTTHLVLAEIDWVLRSLYKITKNNRLMYVSTIKDMPWLKIVDDYDFNLSYYYYSHNSIKFIDCMLASIPKVASKEWVIVSYDKDFKKLPIISKEPGEVVGLIK